MKAIIFARVSSKEQEDGQSIPAQIRRLTEYALRKNFTITQTYQITESSTKETRKQFNEIVSFIKKSKEPFVLICDCVDRLQRSFRDTPILDELRKDGKIEIHFLREGLIVNQFSTNSQLLQWDVGVLFASSYVRQLGDNVKRSQEQCYKNGQWTSKAPYGYRNMSLPSGQKTIIIDSEQAEFVVKIFEEYAKGTTSFEMIAQKMKAEGFPLTSRGKNITDRTVEVMLKNVFYIGKMKVKGLLYQHKYPTLISQELFDTVQNIMYQRTKSPIKYAGKQILLRGLITCENCGSAVSGDIKKGKYTYYSCHNAKRLCQKKWFKEEELLDEVFKTFEELQLSDEQVNEIIYEIEHHEANQQATTQVRLKILNEKLAEVKNRLSKMIDMHIDGRIDSETYHAKLIEYKNNEQSIVSEIKSYDSNSKMELFTAEKILNLARNAKNIFISSKFEEKQQLLKLLFSNSKLSSEKLHLELNEPFIYMKKPYDQHIWRS